MKYWIGYLVAAIFLAVSWALAQFAQAHEVLVDMIYPYMTRMIINILAEWSSEKAACVWQGMLTWAGIAAVVTFVLMIVLRWNFFRWLGWVLAAGCCVVMLNTGLYGLNAYASPLADDISLTVTDYTVSELNEATVYFRDKANELAVAIPRDAKGNPDYSTFEQMAVQAAEGFKSVTYDEAHSVFAGSTVPVKVQKWFTRKGVSGITVPLTGEACVNPDVPQLCMPFAICKEMAHRMCIYSDVDANFAAFLAASHNSSQEFQYAAYLMAYYYCYETLSGIPTSTAKACAWQTADGVNELLSRDLEVCRDFYGSTREETRNIRTEDAQVESTEDAMITFSDYTSSTDLFASWYIQEFILPLHQEEEQPFNPLDPTQVDLTGIVNAPVTG